jgi:dienelactone hydrolase
VDLHEELLDGPLQGVAISSGSPDPIGVVVLAGSSGRVDVERARLFAERGALAVALRWFGGPGQSPGICEIPLETFTLALDRLVARGARRIGFVGVSKGAEAALLVACRDARVRSVVAIAPSSVVWGNIGAGLDGEAYPYRSSWTWRGWPVPFVPYDESWAAPEDSPIAYRSLYEQSLRSAPEAAAAAAIPIEQATADVLVIAGAADAMWPSDTFAAALAERRHTAGRQIEVIGHPKAGHRPYFPGEPAPASSTDTAYGGSSAADAALGEAAWPRVLTHLGLR